jgi:hypothetical protein
MRQQGTYKQYLERVQEAKTTYNQTVAELRMEHEQQLAAALAVKRAAISDAYDAWKAAEESGCFEQGEAATERSK